MFWQLYLSDCATLSSPNARRTVYTDIASATPTRLRRSLPNCDGSTWAAPPKAGQQHRSARTGIGGASLAGSDVTGAHHLRAVEAVQERSRGGHVDKIMEYMTTRRRCANLSHITKNRLADASKIRALELRGGFRRFRICSDRSIPKSAARSLLSGWAEKRPSG
jgi:hypothetical protein